MPEYADPFRAGRHPFQTYLLALACVASVPPLFSEPTAGSIEALLPPEVAIIWSALLLVGCAVALVGVYWPVRQPLDAHSYVTSLFLERVGLAIVWPSALVYSGVVVLFTGWSGMFAAAIIAGFGWAARRRMRDVAKVFGRAIVS
jgi:hypothetical protein